MFLQGASAFLAFAVWARLSMQFFFFLCLSVLALFLPHPPLPRSRWPWGPRFVPLTAPRGQMSRCKTVTAVVPSFHSFSSPHTIIAVFLFYFLFLYVFLSRSAALCLEPKWWGASAHAQWHIQNSDINELKDASFSGDLHVQTAVQPKVEVRRPKLKQTSMMLQLQLQCNNMRWQRMNFCILIHWRSN